MKTKTTTHGIVTWKWAGLARCALLFAPLLFGFLSAPPCCALDVVLVEAESFELPRQGPTWVLDTQFADQMGSPFLLAHGLGEAVKDVSTTVKFPATGEWHVWVRTRDWAAHAGPGPGSFQLVLDGKALEKIYGAEGAKGAAWHWQSGGAVRVESAEAKLTLHDLTGFEGRCDAIAFAKDASADWQPPEDAAALLKFRRDALKLGPVQDAGEFDLVVTGGGYAGLCAAVSAARLGAKVALIQDRAVLGGNASSEVRVGPIGKTNFGPFPRNADIVDRLVGAQDPVQERMVLAEKNVTLFLNTRAYAVEMNGTRVAAVLARDTRTSQERRFRGKLFADCTGDGSIGFLAGAEFRQEREGRDEFSESLAPAGKGDKQMLGSTLYWYSTERTEVQPFPDCPWAMVMPSKDAFEVSKPKYPPKISRPDMLTAGEWNWEGGFNKNTIEQAEYIRDHNFRAIYGTWDFLKNRGDDKARYSNWKLTWMAFQMGRRESRRLMGDYLLKQQDIELHKVYDDGVVTATWYFDIHFPHPQNSKFWPGEEFRSLAFDDPNWKTLKGDLPGREITIKPYPVPYRCFYSRNVPNLFMAGRDISVTHAALSSVRVMKTTGMMGTMVGRAAALCRALDCEPRAIYEKHLAALKSLLTNPEPQTLSALASGKPAPVADVKPAPEKVAPKTPATPPKTTAKRPSVSEEEERLAPAQKQRLILLLANWNRPHKELAAATLAWLCAEHGASFDAYWAAEREGGIFSPHGSAISSGRHDLAAARLLSEYDTDVYRLNDVNVFKSLTLAAARTETVTPRFSNLYASVSRRLDFQLPMELLAVQTAKLPKGLADYEPYAAMETVFRKTLAVPLELDAEQLERFHEIGIRRVWTVAMRDADRTAWRNAGFELMEANTLAPEDTLHTFTQRLAKRWREKASAVDVCEPDLTQYLLPFFARERRIPTCSQPNTQAAIAALPALAVKNQATIYNRYDGGRTKGVGDAGLWPLFRANISVEVVEPGRPAFTALGPKSGTLAQPARSMFDMEPSDAQLRKWAQEKRVLAAWMLHSGEVSHDDAMINFTEHAAWRKLPLGMGVHWQRYAFEPWCMENVQVPAEQGGALGFIEPILHSSGHGVIAEYDADPAVLAAQMKDARDRIAAIAGARFAPHGVYCYMDTTLADPSKKPEALWRAIHAAGFDYVVSSVSPGENRVLFREGDFIVLNQTAPKVEKTSPFVRIKDPADMLAAEKQLRDAGCAGWVIGTLDSPLYAYGPYLTSGHKWGLNLRLDAFFDYLAKGVKERGLIPATPHTIARYARILAESAEKK